MYKTIFGRSNDLNPGHFRHELFKMCDDRRAIVHSNDPKRIVLLNRHCNSLTQMRFVKVTNLIEDNVSKGVESNLNRQR